MNKLDSRALPKFYIRHIPVTRRSWMVTRGQWHPMVNRVVQVLPKKANFRNIESGLVLGTLDLFRPHIHRETRTNKYSLKNYRVEMIIPVY